MKFNNQYILGAMAKLGLAKPVLSAYEALTQGRELRTICNVSQRVRNMTPPVKSQNGDILIPITDNNPVLQFVLASALIARGFNPILLTDMGSLPQEINLKYHWSEPAQSALKQHNLEYFKRDFNVPLHPLGEVLKSHDELPLIGPVSVGDSFRYGDVDISPYAMATTRRYLQRYRLDPSSDNHNRVYKSMIRAGVMLASATEKVIQDNNVIAGINVGGGRYIRDGIPAEILDQHQIEAYSIENGRLRNHVSAGLGRKGVFGRYFDPSDIVTAVSQYEMTDEDRILLRDRLPQTTDESLRRTRYAPEGGTGLQETDRFTVGVFSHLPWDAALSPKAALFPDFYDWLRCTIDTLADYSNMKVYLKAHPAEIIHGTDEHLSDWLEDSYPDLPSHIRFIPPDSQISFYRMMPDLDAGIVYASTVGAEMAYNHIPVVIGGLPPYIDYKIGFEPSKMNEFVDFLQQLPDLVVTPQMHARSERFLFHLFVNKQLPFLKGIFSKREILDITYESLMSEKMNSIIDPIIQGETVQLSKLGS